MSSQAAGKPDDPGSTLTEPLVVVEVLSRDYVTPAHTEPAIAV